MQEAARLEGGVPDETPEVNDSVKPVDDSAPIEEEADVGFDIEVPDIPLPQAAEDKSVKDKFEGAFNFAFIGAGQGGSRIAAAFNAMGYSRVCAINTAQQDMVEIKIPEDNKLVIGGGGAGKDPEKAAALYKGAKEDVLDLMRRSFGPAFDRVFVCAGAGGGTGAGTLFPIVETARELLAALKIEDKGVGVIIALPKNAEGARVNANAYRVLSHAMELVDKGVVSPLIVLDNERIESIYPNLAVDPFWKTANKSVASLFHLFNTIAVKSSRYTSFDATDYSTLLNSGLIVFGATPIAKWDDPTDISYAVRDNIQKNLLAGGLDLGTGKVAGAIIIGGKSILEKVPQVNLDHGFEQLTRIMQSGSMVHRGVYRGRADNLVVYTMIGGLDAPVDRIKELKKFGDV